MCSLGYCHVLLLSTAGVVGLEQLIQCSLLLLSALYMFRAVFRPSSGASKTVCAALGIVMPSCCLLLVWLGWNNPSTPVVDSSKA